MFTTRNKKKKIEEKEKDESDGDDDNKANKLWKFVSDDGGVCQHLFDFEILTKLNRTEQKMFSQTCRASREAIKRAKIELEDKFWIEELSSISQLELAWANYEWGSKGKYANGTEYTRNQEQFCARVAETNDLALLRWVREEKECAWNFRTSGQAAMQGNLDMLKYCCENGCEVDARHCAIAAKNGHLDCLEYLRSKNCPWDEQVCEIAHKNDHIDVLTYAVKNKCPGFEAYEQFIPKQ